MIHITRITLVLTILFKEQYSFYWLLSLIAVSGQAFISLDFHQNVAFTFVKASFLIESHELVNKFQVICALFV